MMERNQEKFAEEETHVLQVSFHIFVPNSPAFTLPKKFRNSVKTPLPFSCIS
jgi:hypothetical protein